MKSTQKQDGKLRDTEVRKERGDVSRKNKESHTVPHDRGDAKHNKKQESPKNMTAASLKTDLVSRSTNTAAESLPLKFENKRMNEGPKKCVEFRKKVWDRYTFKRYLHVEKTDDMAKFNCAMQHDVKNESLKHSDLKSTDKEKSKEPQNVKKDQLSVHRAVSAMKTKTSRAPEDKSTKYSVKNEKTPVIKTITSKMDSGRVFKAVTFVEHRARKQLDIKMPNKEPLKERRNIKLVDLERKVSKTPSWKRAGQKRRSLRQQPSPSSKSVDSQPTEVAKWVPESINQHTQPYYDAWVSKTATASSKLSEKARLEAAKLLQRLDEERRTAPKLLHKYKEEEYAGKIRVRRKK